MPHLGHVKNGVVVPDEGFDLPDDTKVWLVPIDDEVESDAKARSQKLWLEMRRIADLPAEGDDDGFSGADHDKILYGEP